MNEEMKKIIAESFDETAKNYKDNLLDVLEDRKYSKEEVFQIAQAFGKGLYIGMFKNKKIVKKILKKLEEEPEEEEEELSHEVIEKITGEQLRQLPIGETKQ